MHVAEKPGGELVDEQVVTGAGFGWGVMGDGEERVPAEFGIECDFPAGTYIRRRR